jgi:cell division protein FtsZ
MHRAVDCIFKVSAECLSVPTKFLENPKNLEAMTRYAMRHTVSTITELITERGIICIDFADVAAFLRCGTIGRLGTGVATDSERGRTAAMLAMTRLEDQRAPLDTARGILACVQGSTLMTMEDFDAASLAICEVASEDNPLIIGLLTEEYLGNNVRVTILSVT